jgi:hypothetical protein
MGTKTGIINMHFVVSEIERIRDEQDAAEYASLPASDEPVYYYHVERKAKRGKDKWIFVRELWETESRANEIMAKHFADGKHRLRLVVRISPERPNEE